MDSRSSFSSPRLKASRGTRGTAIASPRVPTGWLPWSAMRATRRARCQSWGVPPRCVLTLVYTPFVRQDAQLIQLLPKFEVISSPEVAEGEQFLFRFLEHLPDRHQPASA